MVIRILLALFASGAAGVCFLAGYARLMSGLLIGFGALTGVFFGILFLVPEQSRDLWFPVHGTASGWPFFLLALVLAVMAGLVFTKRKETPEPEAFSTLHIQYCVGGFFAYILSVFLPSLLWFPSEERRLQLSPEDLAFYVLLGTVAYFIGTIISLYLFYKASRGAVENYPDMMRRVVLAIFAIFQFDKMPAFVAFLMIYSPESLIIYPSIAVMALAAYIPVSFFLLKLSWQSEIIHLTEDNSD